MGSSEKEKPKEFKEVRNENRHGNTSTGKINPFMNEFLTEESKTIILGIRLTGPYFIGGDN